MAASGAKYGIMTSHFYWVGAVPAMLFVGVFMMPFYYGSRARSRPRVPQAAVRREDARVQRAHVRGDDGVLVRHLACTRWAQLLSLLLGWNIHASIVISAVIVLVYISLGGLTSAIYNEVLQFFLIVFGFAPLVYLGLREVGGWEGLRATDAGDASRTAWTNLGSPVGQPDGRRVVRPRDGARVRALVRLLVHRFPGRAARDGGRFDERRAAHAGDRRAAEDDLPVPGDRPGHHRSRPDAASRQRHSAGAAARRSVGRLRLQHGAADDDGAVLSRRHARARTDRADGELHVGHGGQRHRLQHRLDVRHLPVLSGSGPERRALPRMSAARRPSSARS